MATSPASSAAKGVASRRQFERIDIRCRARIRIGNRQYAGFIDNISEGGAKFTTLSQIRAKGPVTLLIPDLQPLRGNIRWMEERGAGVRFMLRMDDSTLETWARARGRRR